MKIALFIRQPEFAEQQSLHRLIQALHAHGVETVEINPDSTLTSQPDFLFSIGGDGTLLTAMHLFGNSTIPVVGINFGHLGFLTTVGKDDDINAFVAHFMAGHFTIEQRTLLLLTAQNHNPRTALNEISLHRSLNTSIMRTELYVDDEFVSVYDGDGLIVATPTGSTAYSLSCGGPILTPNSGCFVITPIGAHTLTLRPIIVPDTAHLRLVTDPRHSIVNLGIDCYTHQISGGTELHLRRQAYTVRLVRMQGQNFFRAIHQKLQWGTEVRHK